MSVMSMFIQSPLYLLVYLVENTLRIQVRLHIFAMGGRLAAGVCG